jgi:TetR/AcrR family fatty acid metabolism transcriptional regulator
MASSGASRPKRADRQRREAVILDAAYLELCERGYAEASIARIAQRAGVADGTIYKYVTDKRELLFRVLARAIEGHVSDTIELAKTLKTARDKIEFFCFRHLDFWNRNRRLGLLYASESRTRDGQHWPVYREVNKRYVDVVKSAIEEGVANGEFEIAVPAVFLRDIIIGSIEQLAWSLTSGARAIEPRQMAASVIDIFLRGISGSAAAPPAITLEKIEHLLIRLEQKVDAVSFANQEKP